MNDEDEEYKGTTGKEKFRLSELSLSRALSRALSPFTRSSPLSLRFAFGTYIRGRDALHVPKKYEKLPIDTCQLDIIETLCFCFSLSILASSQASSTDFASEPPTLSSSFKPSLETSSVLLQ